MRYAPRRAILPSTCRCTVAGCRCTPPMSWRKPFAMPSTLSPIPTCALRMAPATCGSSSIRSRRWNSAAHPMPYAIGRWHPPARWCSRGSRSTSIALHRRPPARCSSSPNRRALSIVASVRQRRLSRPTPISRSPARTGLRLRPRRRRMSTARRYAPKRRSRACPTIFRCSSLRFSQRIDKRALSAELQPCAVGTALAQLQSNACLDAPGHRDCVGGARANGRGPRDGSRIACTPDVDCCSLHREFSRRSVQHGSDVVACIAARGITGVASNRSAATGCYTVNASHRTGRS